MADPLATVLLTRPLPASTEFAAILRERLGGRVEIVVSPLLEIVATGKTPDTASARGVIFTSGNGVRFAGPARAKPAYCVGEATTKTALRSGWNAEHLGNSADELVEALKDRNPKGPLLHVSGVHKRGGVAESLTDFGIPTSAIEVYDQRELTLNADATAALGGKRPVFVPLFSPRSAQIFARQVPKQAKPHIQALSATIMDQTSHLPATTRRIAFRPDAGSMVETLQSVLLRVETGETPV